MKYALRLLLPLLALCLLTAGTKKKKDEITIRFHAEANRMDSEKFAQPVELKYPPRQAYIQRVPAISERQIKSMYPFQAADGTWGCAFQLDPSGRLALEVMSTENRGSSVVVFIGTKLGAHQVVDMKVDKPITDGIVTIPQGMTEMEIEALKKKFPPMPQMRAAQG